MWSIAALEVYRRTFKTAFVAITRRKVSGNVGESIILAKDGPMKDVFSVSHSLFPLHSGEIA
jgi:hypothetical protein